nr:N-acetylmuramoyl-L-alanine amidase [Hungatella hathewayi]
MTETAPSFTDVSETVYVTGDQVNLRADASTSAEIVTALSKGTSLKRTAVSDTWSRVVYQEKTCYISTQYVSTVQPETESAKAASTANGGEVKLNSSWKYADFSKINSGAAMLYKSEAASRKGITVCVNAGHGTKGGSSVKTQCHPDGTPKVTGGTTSAGATSAVAVSGGMQFSDGTAEAKVTLAMAKKLKDKLLAEGYDVLMIRETDDVQLDNIARTVIANNMADCHIALHWDSTTSNKGAFYMSVPNVESYRNMEPVKSNWQKHHALGDSLIAGLKGAGVKIFSSGAMEMDLTQTSFSTVPSIDIELGDKASDHSDATLNTLADGLVAGVKNYFGK